MPVDRETFARVRQQVIQTAPAGLSREQFDALLDQELAKIAAEPARDPNRPQGPATIGEMVGQPVVDFARGVASSVARPIVAGGDLIRRATGMERITDNPDVQALTTAPDSMAGTIGSTGADIAQFFLPTGLAGKAKFGAEVLKSGVLTLAQGGTPTSAVASAGLTAAIPRIGPAAGWASGKLRGSAEKNIVQALGTQKEWAKADAAKLAPQILDRGVKGSREAMLAQAQSMSSRVGKDLTAAYQTAAAAGDTVSGPTIRGYLSAAAGELTVLNAAGKSVPIPGTERVLKQLNKLDTFVESLGDDVPVDKAAQIKKTWDRIVSKAGLFGPKAGASATDSADAWAIREAAGGFRELLNRSPALADLNKEAAFWIGLRKVLAATALRTQAQTGGLIAAGMGGSGAVVGALSGDSLSDKAQKAVIGGLLGRQLVKVIQSPTFRTSVSAPLKDTLADALATGQTGRMLSALGKITASLPAQATAAR